MSKNSRLKNRLQKKTQRNLFLTVIGIGLILFILVKFGVPALANFALFLSGIMNNDKNTVKNEAKFIPSPTIESPFTATNSSSLIISGRSIKKYKVIIYVNDEEQESLDSQDDGIFSLEVTLTEGDNTIKAKSENDGKKSDFSNIISVTYVKSAPTLSISSPADGDSFSKEQNKVNVTGKTSTGATVTVNDFWAIMDNDNNFSYELPLKNGENQIKIIATDEAGNKTEKTIKVNYSQ